MPYCTSCGAQANEGQQFCTTCGKPAGGVVADGALPYFPGQPAVVVDKSGLAGWWWRVLAFLIDSVILAVVLELPSRGLKFSFATTVAINVVGIVVYGTLMITYSHGQTVGMKATKIRVVNATDHGGVPLSQSTRRAVAYGVLLLIGSVYHHVVYLNPTAQQKLELQHAELILLSLSIPHYLDLLWPLWDRQNQTLHDKVASTLVVRPTLQ